MKAVPKTKNQKSEKPNLKEPQIRKSAKTKNKETTAMEKLSNHYILLGAYHATIYECHAKAPPAAHPPSP
jgi:hypothetical protein